MLTDEEKLKLDTLHRQRDKELQDVLDEKLYKSIFSDTVRGNVRGVMYAVFAGAAICAVLGLVAAGGLYGLAALGALGTTIGPFITGNIGFIMPAMALLFGYKGQEVARGFFPQLSATAGAMASGIAHKEIRERAMEREKLLENLSPEQEEKIRAALAQTPLPQPEKRPWYHWKVGLTWALVAAAVGAAAVAAPAMLALMTAEGVSLGALFTMDGWAALGAAQFEVPALVTKLGLGGVTGSMSLAHVPALAAIGATVMGTIGAVFGMDRKIFEKINAASYSAATGTLGSVLMSKGRAKQLEPQISRYEAPRPAVFGLTDTDMKELSTRRHGSKTDFRQRLEEARTVAPQNGIQLQ